MASRRGATPLWMSLAKPKRRRRFALPAHSKTALLRYLVVRLRHPHQPLIEPTDDVLEALDATLGLAAPILSATGQGGEAVCHPN